MHMSISHRAAGKQLRAAERALMRWYPDVSLRFIQTFRKTHPCYPLLNGGKAGAA